MTNSLIEKLEKANIHYTVHGMDRAIEILKEHKCEWAWRDPIFLYRSCDGENVVDYLDNLETFCGACAGKIEMIEDSF